MRITVLLITSLFTLPAASDTACQSQFTVVADCYETRGRAQAYNGTPSIRIWKVGTSRLLGIKDDHFEHLPIVVKENIEFGVKIFADFVVCPLSPDQPGHMQIVCVESAKNIRIEDYREDTNNPKITMIK